MLTRTFPLLGRRTRCRVSLNYHHLDIIAFNNICYAYIQNELTTSVIEVATSRHQYLRRPWIRGMNFHRYVVDVNGRWRRRGGYFARKSYRTNAVCADNTTDFIYSSRLLLSCDLNRRPHSRCVTGEVVPRGTREKEERGRRCTGVS